MNIHLFVAGKPSLAYAQSAVTEYANRLKHYGRYEIHYLKAGPSDRVSAELLKRSEGHFRIALDERGSALSTAEWSDEFTTLALDHRIKNLAFLIGAADGHSRVLRSAADRIWQLSALTLQHELALAVLLEQLYRVATLQRGEPYHR